MSPFECLSCNFILPDDADLVPCFFGDCFHFFISGICATYCTLSMETAKANNLRLDDYLLHLLSILPERAEQSKDFEVDDLLPWSEEMRSWFSAV